MRRISLQFLKPGMKVARTILTADGRVLLAAGVLLNGKYIERLREMEIQSVYILDDLFNTFDNVPDVISEETRNETARMVKDSFKHLEHNRRMNVRAVKNKVDDIMDEILSNNDILVNLTDIRSFDDYTFGHSVNVCILSIMTAITLGYHELKLKELGVGALLHDVGKIRITKEILNKPGELTNQEFDEVRLHSKHGYEILRTYEEVPLLSAHISFQHHERWDGKGYPRGLAGEEIHEYARIVAVADVYDALLADRPYRASYSINQAVTILSRMVDSYFDPRILAALISNIAIFPLGSVVVLNTGELGLVVDVHKSVPTRPVIRVMFDRYRKRLSPCHEIDLSRMTTVYIAKVLSEQEIVEITNGLPFDAEAI
ncbi:MAG: HD-GYP domain-containing protein [Ignavibacteriales bacterium]